MSTQPATRPGTAGEGDVGASRYDIGVGKVWMAMEMAPGGIVVDARKRQFDDAAGRTISPELAA